MEVANASTRGTFFRSYFGEVVQRIEQLLMDGIFLVTLSAGEILCGHAAPLDFLDWRLSMPIENSCPEHSQIIGFGTGNRHLPWAFRGTQARARWSPHRLA